MSDKEKGKEDKENDGPEQNSGTKKKIEDATEKRRKKSRGKH